MIKEILGYISGAIVGLAICYGVYTMYKRYKIQKSEKNADVFVEKLKAKEQQSQRLNDLIANQMYVDVLTIKELTQWFKENQNNVDTSAKMLIVAPTEENMRGLDFTLETDLDVNTNIVQLFYNENTGEVLLMRLISFSEIDSNLEAKLIEENGMIVVTD